MISLSPHAKQLSEELQAVGLEKYLSIIQTADGVVLAGSFGHNARARQHIEDAIEQKKVAQEDVAALRNFVRLEFPIAEEDKAGV